MDALQFPATYAVYPACKAPRQSSGSWSFSTYPECPLSKSASSVVPLSIRLLVVGLLFLLWIAMVGRFDAREWLVGLVLCLLVAAAAGDHLRVFAGVRLHPGAPLHFLRWFAYFLVALLKANLDMARRVLTPSLPLNPAFVEVRTSLESPLGKLALANSITLTPGTLAVDIHDDRLLVHWVDASPGTDLEAATARIAAGFERHLLGFLK